jgi:putative N6-adenine-specific DNA methylase
MKNLSLFATATFGVEAVVARELHHLGYEDTTIDNGRIHFQGDVEAICRSNLWLRSAERVFVQVGVFEAFSFDDLFEGTKSLPWEEWLPENAEFPVNGSCVKSALMSISDCQSIIKKAIVERLKRRYRRELFPENGPRYRIEFTILNDRVTVALDTSGAGLHKRGYRTLSYTAPLKETLASAMLLISRWGPDRPLIDPFCGSGTIPIEAAMIALNIAPGLEREFDSQEWPQIPRETWYESLDEARSLIAADKEIRIQGYDINPAAVDIANHHAKLAGVSKNLHIQRRDMREISSRFTYGFIVTNPPYGNRIGEFSENKTLYRDMGKAFSTLSTWSYSVLSSDAEFEKSFGRPANKKRKLYNGGIACQYYQYFGPKPPRDI